ncbi:MAG: hypothetical protein COA32_11205 [Fluviicola sp.]|nr:MAG: hypothetical protein COA32_11205 [Fluviicola sp.]
MKQFIKQIGKTFLFTASCGLLSAGIYGQTQNTGNNIWSFPPNYIKTNGQILALPEGPNAGPFDDYNGVPSNNSHNVMRDIDGNIRFFVVDERVFDNQGRLIDKMYSGAKDIKGAAETVILPDPSNCQRYYIFSTGRSGYTNQSSKEPFYSIVDLSAENIYDNTRDGALVFTNSGTATSIADITPGFYGSSLPGEDNSASKFGNVFIAATEENCNGDRFVYVSTENGIFQYILDENGVTYTNEFILFQLGRPFNQIKMRSGMEVVQLPNGNYRIAVGHDAVENNFRGTGLFTAELDDQGVLVPTSQQSFFLANDGIGTIDTQAYIHGLEFSPDGSILYVTHNTNNNNPDPIEYFDFDNPGSGLQPLNVTDDEDFEMSQMEIDIDGDLAFVTEDRIAALEDPNTPSATNWVNIKVPFGSSYLPNDESTFTTIPTFARAITSYIFPDQVGGMDYTRHLTSSLECLGAISNGGISTWSPGVNNNPFGSANGEVYIDGDLTIPMGTNIQMNGMTFYFTPGSKLIVERGDANNSGARLTLVNSTLTVDNLCFADAMWNGVQVQGYSNENQFPLGSTKQGWFRMFNNSRVEHAYIGAATTIYQSQSTYPFEPGNADFSATGGIVEVSNSTFFNNRQDLFFYSYQAPNGQDNRGHATNTRFITDGALNDPNAFPFGHVTILGNVGINLFGNDYINETPNLYAFSEQGSGVVSINSQVKVKARCQSFTNPCTNFDRSEFRNLYYGVASLSSVSGRKTTIDRSLFINNYFGAYLGNDDFSEVTRNDFEVYRSAAPNETFETFGLYLNGCDGYQVEENTFTEFDDPLVPAFGNTYGVVVNNSGIGDNEIYRNEFFDLKIGSQAQGINGFDTEANQPPTFIQGLQFKCNEYYNDVEVADIAVTSGLIRREQGDCDPSASPQALTKPAGNRFSIFTPGDEIAANPGVVFFEYAHHSDAITWPVNYNASIVALNQCASSSDPVFFDPTKSCPSKIIELGPIGVLPLLPIFRSRLDSLKEVIIAKEELIDDNATAFLIGLIETGNNGTVKNTLLDVSPYLSDEVLIAYINSNPPKGHLKQVLLANSSLSDDVLLAMENINIPNGIMNQINNAQVGKSERDRLISDINYDRTERSLLLNQTIRLVLEDTIMPGRLDTVAVLLKQESEQRRKEQLCDVYLCDRDTSRFNDSRSNIEAEFGQTNYVRMADMNNLLSKETGAFTTDTLRTNSSLREEIEDIAADQNDRINAVRAEALLAFFRDSVKIPFVEPLLPNSGSKMMVNENEGTEQLREMKLYPNPSNGSLVAVEIDAEGYENPTIEVVDLTGKSVAHYEFKDKNKVKITTSDFNAGVYFVKLNDNGRFIETQKLIIQ